MCVLPLLIHQNVQDWHLDSLHTTLRNQFYYIHFHPVQHLSHIKVPSFLQINLLISQDLYNYQMSLNHFSLDSHT